MSNEMILKTRVESAAEVVFLKLVNSGKAPEDAIEMMRSNDVVKGWITTLISSITNEDVKAMNLSA